MFEALRNSTIRMIVDDLSDIDNQGVMLDYYDWDGYAEIDELPNTDLAGLVGFSATQDGEFHDIVCGIGFVTLKDQGLYRLIHMVDHFYTRLKHQSRFTIYNNTGVQMGIATCFTGTTVSPSSQVDVRPAQTLSFTARYVPDGL